MKRKRVHKENRFVGSHCIDEMSSWMPVDYHEPTVISGFLKSGDRIIAKMIKEMKVDQFNDGFLDQYINNLIDVAISDLNNQRIFHLKAIEDIRFGQQSKLNMYKAELDKIENELFELRQEVMA